MNDPNVITLVDTWPKAVVAVCLILAVTVVPSLLAYLAARQARTNTAEAVTAAQAAHTTLTQNSGGSTVKGALDRIERRQESQGRALTGLGERLTAVEESVTKPQG